MGESAAYCAHLQFLPQFANQRLFVGFTSIHFAAGEFPEAAMLFVEGALTDEEAVGALNNGGDDMDHRRDFRRARVW